MMFRNRREAFLDFSAIHYSDSAWGAKSKHLVSVGAMIGIHVGAATILKAARSFGKLPRKVGIWCKCHWRNQTWNGPKVRIKIRVVQGSLQGLAELFCQWWYHYVTRGGWDAEAIARGERPP